MPDLMKELKGNTEPSKRLRPLGVCNEHVPSPEGKICSGLHGNMQRLAEMTNPVSLIEISNKTDDKQCIFAGCAYRIVVMR